MRSYRNNPEGPENTEATKANKRAVFAAKMEAKQETNAVIRAEMDHQKTGDWWLIFGDEPTVTATVHSYQSDLDKERAELIVRAVNNHEALVAQLTKALDSWPQFDSDADVSGADMVEWYSGYRSEIRSLLKAVGQPGVAR